MLTSAFTRCLRGRFYLASAAAAVAFVGAGQSAQAGDKNKATAKAHYETGTRFYDIREYGKALLEYKSAYLAQPDPAFLFNIGQCYRNLGQDQEALKFFQLYLKKASPDDPNRRQAEARVDRPAAPPVAAEESTLATPAPERPAPQLARGCAANQVPIPGGTFWMGEMDLDKNSKPVHKVTLSPYCMDKTEVTVASFRACVQAGDCQPPSATVDWKDIKPEDKAKWSQFCNWRWGGLDQHPINCVDWNQASAYCEWTGGRLPTEAEWEYAARGKDARPYPWGNEPPDAQRLNACGSECASMAKERLNTIWAPMYAGYDGWLATAPVGSYPKGASPLGILDMAGNVWEWTADSFEAYSEAPSSNPHRFSPGASPRVDRGGGWFDNNPAGVRAAVRLGLDPAYRNGNLGFRCARGARM